MNCDKTVSIIVTTYNQEKMMKRCIDSIIGQTYRDLQIILVDNGSTDLTPKYCDEYAANDNRVDVIHLENNHGISPGRNAGIDVIKGKYTLFVDGDDWMEKDMIEYLIDGLTTADADISICNYFIDHYDRSDVPKIKKGVLSNKDALRELLEDVSFKNYVWNKLMKTELIKDIKFDGSKYEDIRTVYKFFVNAKKVVVLDKPKYHYIIHDNGATTGSKQPFMSHFLSTRYAIERYDDIKEYQLDENYIHGINRLLLTYFLIGSEYDNCVIDNDDKNVKFITDFIITNYDKFSKYSNFIQKVFYNKIYKEKKMTMPNKLYKLTYRFTMKIDRLCGHKYL